MRLGRVGAIAGLVLVALAGGAAAAGWLLSAPTELDAASLPAHEPDLANGETLFWAGGCASCHAATEARGDDLLSLVGGRVLVTPFGRFHVPNITPHPTSGIGGWSDLDFVAAMQLGVTPDGRHYYPAFPYTSYARMTVADVLDLKAFLDTLPAEMSTVPDHELGFPFNIRRGIGLWKRLHLKNGPVVQVDAGEPLPTRGRYLVEGPGHCGECHTPRDWTGGLDHARWLAGGPAPEGEGRVPNITSGEGGIGSWSARDIVYALESGFTPDYDTLGGSMAAVQANMARLPAEDREAIAAYLKAVPPLARTP
jgi:mono/diheme cytochrome c family protein